MVPCESETGSRRQARGAGERKTSAKGLDKVRRANVYKGKVGLGWTRFPQHRTTVLCVHSEHLPAPVSRSDATPQTRTRDKDPPQRSKDGAQAQLPWTYRLKSDAIYLRRGLEAGQGWRGPRCRETPPPSCAAPWTRTREPRRLPQTFCVCWGVLEMFF